MILKSDILEIASLLDEEIEKASHSEKTRVELYEEDILKGLSHDPFRPHLMNESSPYHNPYRQMEDGSFLPHSVEHWQSQGKEVGNGEYLTTRVLYDRYLAPTENRFAALRRSLDNNDLIKAGAVPIGTVHRFADGHDYKKMAEGRWDLVPSKTGAAASGQDPKAKAKASQDIEGHAKKIADIKDAIKQKIRDEGMQSQTKEEAIKEALRHVKTAMASMYDGPMPEKMQKFFDKHAKSDESAASDKAASSKKKVLESLKEKTKKRGIGAGREVSLTRDELQTVLESGKYALVSAGRNPANEADVKLTDKQISQRYQALQNDLKYSGNAYSKVAGHYGGKEDSFLVMVHDANKDEIKKLGKKYNQDSVIYSEGGKHEMHFTSGPNEGKVHKGEGLDPSAESKDDYYSEVQTEDGKKVKFSLNFDFDKMEGGEKENPFRDGQPQLAQKKIAPKDETNNFATGKYSAELDSKMMRETKGKDVNILMTSLFQKNAQKELAEVDKRLEGFVEALKKEGIAVVSHCSREKSAGSLLKKMNGKWKDKTLDQVTDGVAGRIVVKDQEAADRLLSKVPRLLGMQVLEHGNKTKDEGYRAHHLLMRTPGGFIMELQVKTQAQNAWAEWSHNNVYKNDDLKVKNEKGEMVTHPDAQKYANDVSAHLDKIDRGQTSTLPEAPEIIKKHNLEFDPTGKKVFNSDFNNVFDVNRDTANLVHVDKLISRDSPKDAIDRSAGKLENTLKGEHKKREPLTVWKVNKPDGGHYYSVRDGNTTLQMLRDKHGWTKFPVSVEKEIKESELTPVAEHARKKKP